MRAVEARKMPWTAPKAGPYGSIRATGKAIDRIICGTEVRQRPVAQARDLAVIGAKPEIAIVGCEQGGDVAARQLADAGTNFLEADPVEAIESAASA